MKLRTIGGIQLDLDDIATMPPISGGGEVALRHIQAALEVTRGTALAATRKVYAKGLMDKQINLITPDEDRGTFVNAYRSAIGTTIADFPALGSCTFEDLAWWFQLALKGGVAGVLRAVAAYDYTFVPSLAVDDLKSATFEGGDDTQAYQFPYGMVDSFDIEGSLNNFWKFNAKIIGADMKPQAFTAALGERAVEDVDMYLTKLAVGAAGAVPSAYMTGRFIHFKLTVNNHLSRKFFADGVLPTIGGIGRAEREITLEITFEGNAATIAERAVWEAGTSRVARITASGSAIAGSTGPVLRTVDLVIPGRWASFKMGDNATNTIFVAMLKNEYDAALGYDISAVVTNGLAALP
jgi:hypothetical protein